MDITDQIYFIYAVIYLNIT